MQKEILANRIALKRRQNNEAQLQKEVSRLFKRMKKEVLSALEEYWSDYQMWRGQIDLICAPIHELHKEYYEIIEKYKRREYKLGRAEAERNIQRVRKKHSIALKEATTMPIKGFINYNKDNGLFATIPQAEQRMLDKTFKASENTLSRVDSQINQIITDGYRSGAGINQVANDLTKRFDQLGTWEAKRIARTEIHNAHNTAIKDQYKEQGVEYTQWIAAGDDRTRDSHAEIDGEIIPLGGKYSNGLEYPGDTTGPIEEWINCRCSNAPFVVPYGYLAPSFSPFREDDLIPIETPSNPLEQATQQEPVADLPTDLNGNTLLSKEQMDKLSFNELAEHHGAEYKGLEKNERDGKNYHTFEQTYDNGETLTLKFEEGAVKSYTKKGWISPNEIINEVFKVPEAMKRQTDEIWFKNTNQGIVKRLTKSGYDSLGAHTGGYNSYDPLYGRNQKEKPDPHHRIVINPKYFKGGSGKSAWLWEPRPEDARNWIMTINHEFTHSIDQSREYYQTAKKSNVSPLYCSKEYRGIHKAEPDFTWYANTQTSEAFAEHGGYVSMMLNHPELRSKKITIQLREGKGKTTTKDITFYEYKNMYPKHYNYFKKLFKERIPRY